MYIINTHVHVYIHMSHFPATVVTPFTTRIFRAPTSSDVNHQRASAASQTYIHTHTHNRRFAMTINVSDNGIGIPENKKELLFKPFSQVYMHVCVSMSVLVCSEPCVHSMYSHTHTLYTTHILTYTHIYCIHTYASVPAG
jgi:hypothetical protein